MREIEFRFWDIEGKQMWSWEEIKQFLIDEPSQTLFNILGGDHWIPMQYTGLKDKNGNKIFEGDVLLVDSENYDVLFDEGIFYLHHLCGEDNECVYIYESLRGEVIGNIHEVTK